MLGLAFLLLYPLFLFGASCVGRDAALIGALAVVVTLSATFAARVHGPTMAGRVVVLQLVLLGAFTYAMFDRALTGLIFTVGATLLVAYFMLARGRKMPPRPADATSLLQPNTPLGVTSVADQDREA